MSRPFKPCVVIPVYNHERTVGAMVDAVLAQNLPCILVDDGSAAECAGVLDDLAATHPTRITLLRHATNRGKGSAVVTGFRHAAEAGYTHALQIDADGQHRAADIPRFLERAAEHPDALILGSRVYDDSVPRLRFYARYLTHVWVWINTLSLKIDDSMCGFRVYPLAPVIALARRRQLGERMSFDIDILVRLYWAGLEIVNVPTPVRYPADGVSHFRAWSDNVEISRAHARLFLGMLLRLPTLIARKWNAQ
jgi:glycosyltransferase involved in cell wall biosynthesis